eukprot:CFRG8384T1
MYQLMNRGVTSHHGQSRTFRSLRKRELLGHRGGFPYHELYIQAVNEMKSIPGCRLVPIQDGEQDLLSACAYSPGGSSNKSMLAIGSDNGYLYIYPNAYRLPCPSLNPEQVQKLQTPTLAEHKHNGLIFDVDWSNNTHVLTSGGDTMLRLTDVEYGNCRTFSGHEGSVRTGRFQDNSDHIFVSCSRDGSVALWDTRVNTIDGTDTLPVDMIKHAHVEHNSASTKKSSLQASNKSASSAMFVGTSKIVISAGVDGLIKLWDTRYNHKASKGEGQCLGYIPHYGNMLRPRAYSSLDISKNDGNTVVASCLDEKLYVFELSRSVRYTHAPSPVHTNKYALPETGPVNILSGHGHANFYTRGALNCTDDIVACGADQGRIFLYKTRGDSRPLAILESGYTSVGEVNGIAWSPSDAFHLAACTDEGYTRVWGTKDRGSVTPPKSDLDFQWKGGNDDIHHVRDYRARIRSRRTAIHRHSPYIYYNIGPRTERDYLKMGMGFTLDKVGMSEHEVVIASTSRNESYTDTADKNPYENGYDDDDPENTDEYFGFASDHDQLVMDALQGRWEGDDQVGAYCKDDFVPDNMHVDRRQLDGSSFVYAVPCGELLRTSKLADKARTHAPRNRHMCLYWNGTKHNYAQTLPHQRLIARLSCGNAHFGVVQAHSCTCELDTPHIQSMCGGSSQQNICTLSGAGTSSRTDKRTHTNTSTVNSTDTYTHARSTPNISTTGTTQKGLRPYGVSLSSLTLPNYDISPLYVTMPEHAYQADRWGVSFKTLDATATFGTTLHAAVESSDIRNERIVVLPEITPTKPMTNRDIRSFFKLKPSPKPIIKSINNTPTTTSTFTSISTPSPASISSAIPTPSPASTSPSISTPVLPMSAPTPIPTPPPTPNSVNALAQDENIAPNNTNMQRFTKDAAMPSKRPLVDTLVDTNKPKRPKFHVKYS